MRAKFMLLQSVFLVFLLLLGGLPGPVAADAAPAVTLEQAIRTVKDNFDIPADYSTFSSSFQNNANQPCWYLNWNSSQEPGGSFHAQVDAETGEITNMSTWKSEGAQGSTIQLPLISRAQARDKAVELVNRLASRHLTDLQLQAYDDQLQPISSYGPASYNFRWQRVSQGVPFPDNGVNIDIRGDNGTVSRYNLNWSEGTLPAVQGAISPEKAQQVFTQSGMLELQYFQPSGIRPMKQSEKPALMLVYKLDHPSGGVIDALSGEPLKPDMIYYNKYLLGGGGGGGELALNGRKDAVSSVQPPVTPLSPEELKEIEKTSKLISQEQAIQSIKKWVEIPSDLTLNDASLVSEGISSGIYSWTLSWNSGTKDGRMQSWINARVNAGTGELLGFDISDQSASQAESGLVDRQAARTLAEDFLKKVQARHFSEVKLYESDSPWNPLSSTIKDQNPSTQYFNYHRLVNGIDFPGNSLNVTVDTVKKRITNYSSNWQDLNFPSPAGVLDASQAGQAFLNTQPLTLSYCQLQGPLYPGKIQLVYQPLSPTSGLYGNMIDARTGQPLDWQGKPITQKHALSFDDIQGNFAADDITLLGQAGLFGEYGASFHPDENVTQAALLKAMLMARDNNSEINNFSNDEVVSQARLSGWVKEEIQPGAAVSREDLARYMIRYLNLDRATHAQGVFQVPYADAASLNGKTLAYAALAYGLGIIHGDGSSFDAGHIVTRAEAAAALVHTLKVEP